MMEVFDQANAQIVPDHNIERRLKSSYIWRGYRENNFDLVFIHSRQINVKFFVHRVENLCRH